MADRTGSTQDDEPTNEPGGGPADASVLDEGEEPSPLGAAAPETVGRSSRRMRPAGDKARVRSLPSIRVAGLVLVGILILALVPTVASGLVKTPRDRVGISYGGGPFEGPHFQRIVQPGSNLFFNGFFDPLYLYPSDQQTYVVSKNPAEGQKKTESIKAPSKDRVQLEFQVAVYFKLNTDKLQEFHEQLGLRYKAYTLAGWNFLIRDTFRQQIENALQEETRRSDVADLYGNAELLVALQQRLQARLSQRLTDALGEQYFCSPRFKKGGKCDDPTFVVKSIEIPPLVGKAFESNRTSQVLIKTKENEVLQRRAEAEGIRELSAALAVAGDNYVLLKAIESGSIKFWVLPDSAGLTLTTPGTGTGSAPATPAPAASGTTGGNSTTSTTSPPAKTGP